MNNVIVLKNYQSIKESGRHYRIICMTGEKRGEVYYIRSNRILMGRNKNADITVYDSQSSREHIELSKLGSEYIITDLKSNNGVIVNGKKVKQTQLKTKDRIIIGKTVYKYEIVDIEESEDLPQNVEESNSITVKDKKNKNVLFLVLIVIALFFLLDGGDNTSNKPITSVLNQEENLFSKERTRNLSSKENKEKKKIDTIMHRGVRELREGNYYRAISEFNLAIIVDSQNSRAITYKRKAKDLQDKEIESYFNQAIRNFENYHYHQVIKDYCQIIKILEDFPEDERRKSAEENLIHLVEKFGVDEDAVNCN